MGAALTACVRYLLFFFNLIFALAGLGLLVLGALSEYYMVQYQMNNHVDESIRYLPISVMVVGAVITIIAFFGCCGSVKQSHCMLYTFGVFLVTLFVLEIAAGVAAYMFREQITTQFKTHLNDLVEGYYVQPDYMKIMDGIQYDFKCCGSMGPNDYAGASVPNSCCVGLAPQDTCTAQQAFPDGCYTKLFNLVQNLSVILLAVGGGVALVQLIGIIFSFCLANSIRRGYEIV